MARYLWKSGEWQLEWLPLFSVDKMSYIEIGEILDHYKMTWTQQSDEYFKTVKRSSPIKHLCFFLEKFFLLQHEVNPDNDFERFNGVNFCHHHMMHNQSTAILVHAINNIDNSTYADRTRIELARTNLGVDKSHAGYHDEAVDLLLKSYENALNEYSKLFFNADGLSPPYNVMLMDRLPSNFEKVLISTAKTEKIKVNSPVIPNSSLAAPITPEYYDRETHLFRIRNVYQEAKGIFRLQENSFIFYDVFLFSALHSYLKQVKSHIQLPIIRVEHGIFLATYLHNHYHWTIEAMSRLVYLMEIGFFSQYKDVILVLNDRTAIIEESLRRINFPNDRILYVNFQEQRVFFDNLYWVASDPWENPKLPVHPSMQQQASCTLIQTLNREFNPDPLPLKDRKKIVYVGRSTAKLRKTCFDPQLTAKLKSLYGKDFYAIQASPATLEEHRKIFSEARIILGPHGAGLSNLIFTVPNETAIIEFPITSALNNRVFSYLSGCLDMYYWVIPSMTGLHIGNYDCSPQQMDDVVNAVISVANFMKSLQ